MKNRVIIMGTCLAAVVALAVVVLGFANPVFKLKMAPDLENHFSNDKKRWWKELPVEALPSPSGIYNDEGAKGADEDLGQLNADRSILGDLPIIEVSHSQDGSVEIILSKWKASWNCGSTGKPGIIKDEVRLRLEGYADIDYDGVAEICVFLGRAHRSDTCAMGTGNFMGYGPWAILGKETIGSKVELREMRRTDCSS
jgi:hypothetical protein